MNPRWVRLGCESRIGPLHWPRCSRVPGSDCFARVRASDLFRVRGWCGVYIQSCLQTDMYVAWLWSFITNVRSLSLYIVTICKCQSLLVPLVKTEIDLSHAGTSFCFTTGTIIRTVSWFYDIFWDLKCIKCLFYYKSFYMCSLLRI